MWPDKNILGIMASIIVIAMLFLAVGYKVGERHAPVIKMELIPCE